MWKQSEEKASSKAERRMKRRKKKWMAAAAVLILAAAGGWMGYRRMQESRQTSAKTQAQTTAKVERRDIVSQLSSSGTLEPKDTYTITSLVEGEVALADFEEGDQVEKGQILYQIDATSMESEIQSANNSLARAQESLSDAQSDYGEIQAEISGNTYKATKSGFIKELYIDVGDKVGANTKICDIYDDLTMEIRLPFLSGEAAVIAPGSPAVLTLTDTGEQVNGIVTAVSEREEALTGGTLVRQVTIEAANPGGLTTETAATAAIGDCLSASEADFEAKVDTVMSAELDSNVEVEALLVNEGSYITKGTPIFRMTAKSAEKLLKNYSDSVDKAKESLETAQNKVDSTQDSYENYTITAPISGQVITKTAKQGDNISKNSGSGTTMAVIYDLSALTFEMWIDELDIQKVQVGQTVQVTADAAEGQTFTGTVTNVSLESSASNGVTNYPVTVTMESSDGLLPGMNVDGVIILEQAEDTLSVPVDSLMRGNLVYVKDDTVTEADGAVPAGFRAVEVETGLISEDYVEIASGLEEGQEVYVSKSSKSDTFMMMPGAQMAVPMDGGPAAGGAAPAGGPGGSGGGNRSGGSGSQGGRP